jgi:hypothetical protein
MCYHIPSIFLLLDVFCLYKDCMNRVCVEDVVIRIITTTATYTSFSFCDVLKGFLTITDSSCSD